MLALEQHHQALGKHHVIVDDDDPLAAQWLIRVFLALWCWPLKDTVAQRRMLERFLGPPFVKAKGA